MKSHNRSESRNSHLYKKASKGFLNTRIMVYPSEMTNLEKEGFRIYDVKPSKKKAGLYHVTVDWSLAFGLAIPHIIHSYIIGIVEACPQKHINNFAQELYVIAKKSKR